MGSSTTSWCDLCKKSDDPALFRVQWWCTEMQHLHYEQPAEVCQPCLNKMLAYLGKPPAEKTESLKRTFFWSHWVEKLGLKGDVADES